MNAEFLSKTKWSLLSFFLKNSVFLPSSLLALSTKIETAKFVFVRLIPFTDDDVSFYNAWEYFNIITIIKI